RYQAAAGGPGLRRFKQGFAPVWRPRYISAPGIGALALAGLDIALQIRGAGRTAPRPAPEAETGPLPGPLQTNPPTNLPTNPPANRPANLPSPHPGQLSVCATP
ncbi:MAG: hypothetical protein HKN63_01425, partial [Rhodobacteraceae bacterium]|nr:hypothetical protein [Paracoccaceae bacterium]